MKALDGGKLYIGLLGVVVLLAAFYFAEATTAKPVSQEIIEQQEQATREQTNAVRETALEWSASFFSTTGGIDAWVSAMSPLTSGKYLKELESIIRGQLDSGDELLGQTRSYLEAGREQEVLVTADGVFSQDDEWHACVLAQASCDDLTVDISIEVIISQEGEELVVTAARFQQLGD